MSLEVDKWLQELGLEQYAAAFRDHDIDGELLQRLTTEDLRELGVASIGHRRRLLDAIAALQSASPTLVAVGLPLPAKPAAIVAERRQLTVMFCDIVGSTALSTRFDPEDLRTLIGAYHRAVADAVGRFTGYVAKYMGDGVLIYFGYPQAHEDDAESAIRASLAVVAAVGALPGPVPLQVRIGIATGLAVVGDLIGTGAAKERGVVGETPNLAARLQALAQPDTIIIADATRRQVGTLFDLADLGLQTLAGFGEKQPAWRVVGERVVASRFEALYGTGTPLIGRDEELDVILRRWARAKAGEGRVVLLSGEPGIGKSRLTAAVMESLEAEPHTRLRYFCSPHHRDSALWPVIGQLERAAGFAREDTDATKDDKMRALLAPAARDAGDLALLAELLSLPNDVDALHLSLPRKREKLFAALLDQIEAEAARQPVLLIFEDAHWIDPSSRELLDLAVQRLHRLPILLLITHRPEFQPPWTGRAHVASLTLNRLGEREGGALVQRLAGNAALAPEIVAEIVARTDGVPLFVEELTKAVLEGAAQRDRVSAVLGAAPLTALSVPATLNASLMARLDRLGPVAKEVAQVGAVIGRDFSYELIAAMAARPDSVLQATLGHLVQAELLFCRGVPPHAAYQFKHALVQDVAYGTLLRGPRQDLHARAAAALERDLSDVVERQPELLAHHLTGAGETEAAIAQWLKAGQRSAAASHHEEALSYFDQGLTLISNLPETAARDGLETSLLLARGGSLYATKGAGSAEALAAYGRAYELTERHNDSERLIPALWGFWVTNQNSLHFDAARGLSEKLLLLTKESRDDGHRLQAHHAAWTTHIVRGEPAFCHYHCAVGQALYDAKRHAGLAQIYGAHDPGVCAHQVGGWAGWLLGYPEQARTSAANAVHLAVQLGHPVSLMFAHSFAALVGQFCRDPEPSLHHIDAAEAVVAEQRLALWLDARVLRGGAVRAQDSAAEVVASIRAGLAEAQVSTKLFRPYAMALLGEALRKAGDHEAGLAAVTEGLAMIEETGERWWEAELHRLHGELLLARRDTREASEQSFQIALRIARAQQAKSLELRAATSLARLRGEQGRRSEATALLVPVYKWFTEGLDTADLQDARVLLDALT